MKYLFSILLALTVFFSFAQDQSTETATQQEQTVQEDDMVSEEQAGGYVYRPNNRRDPFWDPLRGTKESAREKKVGIAGLTINELTLEGIMFISGNYQAQFRGPDNRPWTLRTGDMVYDGEVIKIDLNTVVFRQNLPLAMGGTRDRIVKKTLNPEEEK